MELRKVTELQPNPLNPRGPVAVDDSILELSESIKSLGVLQPLLITSDGIVITGHRRLVAASLAEVDEVPVIIKDVSEETQLTMMLIENIQRRSLNPVQEGQGFLQLSERGMTTFAISKATGVGATTIATRLNIVRLPASIHYAFADGSLPAHCAECLNDLPEDEQIKWVETALAKNLTGSELCVRIKQSARIREAAINAPMFQGSLLARIWERVEDGCYTPETIRKCGECGRDIFGLSDPELHEYLQRLVDDGRAEWRKQGGKKDDQRGMMPMLCVPKGTPSGDTFAASRGKSLYEDDEEAA